MFRVKHNLIYIIIQYYYVIILYMAIKLRIKDRKRKSKNRRRSRNSSRRKTYKKKMKGGNNCSSNIFSGGSKVPTLMGHEITGEPLNLQQANLMPETSNTGFHFKQPVMEGGKKRRRKQGKKHKKSKKHKRKSNRKSRRKSRRKANSRKRKSRRIRKQGGGGILSTVGLDDINYAIYGAENALQSSVNVLKGDSPVISSDVMKGQYTHD